MPENVIELTELSKSFHVGFRRKRIDAVRSLSLQVRRGEIFGLIGPNGAGKTTTIKMLTGLIRPTGGRMRLLGYDGFDRRCSRRMGYLPEISYYYESLTAFEILDFYAKLYGIRESRSKTVEGWLERVGLGGARDKRLGQFSKGMLQRIGLAQALIGDPEVVILDEPQSGLDPIGRRDVSELILECQRHGKTIFFSSHILPDVERLCDRVGVIRAGRMEMVGTLRELLSGGRHLEIVLRGLGLESLSAELCGAFSGISCGIKNGEMTVELSSTASHEVNAVLLRAISAGVEVCRVMERGMDLEALFMKGQSER